MRSRLCYLIGLTGLAACSGNSPAPVAENPTAYMVASGGIDLGTLGGATSGAADINDRGVVVGSAQTAAGNSVAFRWTAGGGMRSLGTLPGGRQSAAGKILDNGVVLGWSDDAAGRRLNVIWSAGGRIEAIDIPPLADVTEMVPADFNARGEMVGWAVGDEQHGWYWSKATGTIDLRDRIPSCMENYAYGINARGTITGMYCGGPQLYPHPYLYRMTGAFLDLTTGFDGPSVTGYGVSINDADMVAGLLATGHGWPPRAFIYRKSLGTVLLPARAARYPDDIAMGINLAGVAVGASGDQDDYSYLPAAWPDTKTLLLLDPGPWSNGMATAINNHGQVVGSVWGNGPGRAMLWQLSPGAAPMPAAMGDRPPGETSPTLRRCLEAFRLLPAKGRLVECLVGGVGTR